MRQGFPSHLRSLLTLIGASLVLVAALNLVVDPFRSFGFFRIGSLEKAAAGASTRTGKGQMIAGRDWDILLLGTSRVEGAMDPAHPAFAGLRVYNAGLPGAEYMELDHAARAAMKRGTLKRLILCLDLFCFDTNWHYGGEGDPSLADPALNHAEYYIANLLSLRATEASFQSIRGASRGATARDYPLGLFAPHQTPGTHTRADWPLGGALKLTLPAGIDEGGVSPFDEDRFRALADLLDDASRAGVEVTVVQLPMHAVGLEGYAALHIWPVYEQWIRTLTGVVASHNRRFPGGATKLWDFCRYNDITMDPAFEKSQWFYDSFHPKVPLGDLVIEEIMGTKLGRGKSARQLGFVVTEENVESHLAALRRGREAYYTAHPELKQIDIAIARAYRDDN